MDAALFYEVGQPLKVDTVPDPDVEAGTVLVKVIASGLCDTDYRLMQTGIPMMQGPIIMGHQIAGVVAKVGDGVQSVERGDSVIVQFLVHCGSCYYCLNGRENLCENWQAIGVQRPGGFAQFVLVPEQNVIKVPSGLSHAEASLIPCGFATPYRAIKRAQVGVNDTVVVVGARLWGLAAIRLCHLAGARVILVDDDEKRLARAHQLGADATFNLNRDDLASQIQELTYGRGADVALDFSGDAQLISLASQLLRKGGRLVIVGRAGCFGPVSVDILQLMFGEIEVTGACLVKGSEVRELVELVERGALDLGGLISDRIVLVEINDGFAMLASDRPVSVVIDM
jgi:2-desacetyl-2-hydroxyethyl bacteriochlorophyllide A dehydrogenase